MSGFTVRPERLQLPAAQADQAARTLADAAQALGAVVAPTGRADSALQCVRTLRALASGLDDLAVDARREAAVLRAACSGYSAVDARAVGP